MSDQLPDVPGAPGQDAPGQDAPGQDAPESTGRRRALMLGAAGAAAVLSVRPAFAQTNASVMTCQIQVPDPGRRSSYIAADGSVVPSGTPGAFRGPARPFTGEEVRRALSGGQLPNTTPEQNRAYVAYIRHLQSGTAGFTCFASLQMPRG